MQKTDLKPGRIIASAMKESGKVRSACSLCQNFCGIIAYVENGRVVKLEGDPENPRSKGHLCAKGLSGFVNAYSPHRVTKPLMRTNPEKGVGVDPKWKEISWDEAIDIVASRLKSVKEKAEKELGRKLSAQPSQNLTKYNPWSQRIMMSTFDHWALFSGVHMSWIQALDAMTCVFSAACYCGNAVHPPSYLNTSTFEVTVDPDYSKYVLLIGAQAGSIIHYDTMNVARHIAENRPGGIKVVSIDPMAGYAGSKAEEWVPIRPGTDAAFILALVNLLVNEYKIFDVEFVKRKTNGPYLVGDDGLYVRDTKTNKPLIWDSVENKPKVFDDGSIRDFALEGTYSLDGRKLTPGFQLIKDHVRRYTPEFASDLTTIPSDTIRKIAKELGEAACIGQTITIDGKTLPYRPVSVVWYRGLSAHAHSYMAGFAALMLPTLLGAIQVPGGTQGHPPSPEYASEDGMLGTRPWFGPPYPPREVTRPVRGDAFELFPVAPYSQQFIPIVLDDPKRFGIDSKNFVWPEIMFTFRDNLVKNTYSSAQVVRGLLKIPFIVSLNIDLDETANALSDIVFPDLHHIEKLGEGLFLRIGEPGFWYAAKPVMNPPFDPPWDRMVNNGEIFLAIAERAGFLGDVYQVLNTNWKLRGTQYELNPDGKYTYEELVDRRLKVWLGPEKGLDWLMSDKGGLMVWKATPEERYKGAFRQARLHLYYEFLVTAKKNLDRELKALELDWWDTDDYRAIPDWKPCSSYSNRRGDFNLFLINYKVPMMAHAVGRFNPVPMQLVKARTHLDAVLIHPETAARLGIVNGEEVVVESSKGKKQHSVVHVTERVHPEVVACSQHKLRRGVDFNEFTELDDGTFDFVSGAIDSCILVKVSKAPAA